MEVWKDIPGYEGVYQVSDLGRVKSLSRELYNGHSFYYSKEKILSQSLNKGYFYISLRKNKKPKMFGVHQLVAMAFLNHTPCGYDIMVDHIDNKPNNNKLENLQLLSNRENCSKDKVDVGICFDNSIRKWRSDIQIKGTRVFLGNFNSKEEALNVYSAAIENIEKYTGINSDFLDLIYNILGYKRKKPRGCSFVKKSKKWMSCISLNGKNINLGTYSSKEEASSIYELAKCNSHKYKGNNSEFRDFLRKKV